MNFLLRTRNNEFLKQNKVSKKPVLRPPVSRVVARYISQARSMIWRAYWVGEVDNTIVGGLFFAG
jgi:hypothetical protein